MGNDGDGRMGGRELGRRFTDSAGSRRGHGGENAILRSHGREQPRMDSTGRRQRAGGREPRTAGAAGRTREQDSRQAGAAGGTTSLFPLHKYICCVIRIGSDNVSLQEQR